MNTSKFPNLPIDSETVEFNGRTYTYTESERAWYDTNVQRPIEPSLVDRSYYSSGIAVVTNITDINNDVLWDQIRHIRDLRIAELDWRYNRYNRLARLNVTQIDDLTKLDAYAQALADITKESNPYNIVWPTL